MESCSSVKSVKYLYKYVYKGYDSTNLRVSINQNGAQETSVDEILNFYEYRYVSSPEAVIIIKIFY